MKPNVFDRYLEFLESEEAVKCEGEFLCTAGHEIKRDAVFEKGSEILLRAFREARYDFVRYSAVDMQGISREEADDILQVLVTEKRVVKVTEDIYTLTEYMEAAERVLREKLKEDPQITIAEVRDLFGTSRKSAKPILEYMDRIKVTKKMGRDFENLHKI